MHNFVRLLQLAGLLGMGLSLAALGLAVYLRLDFMLKRPPGAGGGPDSAAWLLTVLDAFKEPGIAFLLSAVLFTVCEIAVRVIARQPEHPPAPDGGYDSPP